MSRVAKRGKRSSIVRGKKNEKRKSARKRKPVEVESRREENPQNLDAAVNDDRDDDAPDEIPIAKSGADFIPLTKSKKRKRKKPNAPATDQDGKEAGPQAVEEESEATTKRKRSKFIEKVPGQYVGDGKLVRFRVVDLSSNANNSSYSHKQAALLKRKMFDRHRRRSGAQLLGQLQKSKMVGKG